MRATTPQSTDTHVYYSTQRKLMLVGLAAALFAMLASLYGLIDPPANRGGLFTAFRWFTFIASLYNAGFFGYLAHYKRLVLSPHGIVYYGFGYSIRSTWDNVQRIGALPGYPGYKGLWLHQPALADSEAFWWRWKPRGDRQRFIPLAGFVPPTYFISMERFQKLWYNSDLARNIRQYAPHLFSDGLDR